MQEEGSGGRLARPVNYPLLGLRARVRTTEQISATEEWPTQTELLGTPPFVNDSLTSLHADTAIDSVDRTPGWTSALSSALNRPPVDLLFLVDPWKMPESVNSSVDAPTTEVRQPPAAVQPGLSAQPMEASEQPVPEGEVAEDAGIRALEEEAARGDGGGDIDMPEGPGDEGAQGAPTGGVAAASKRSRQGADELELIHSEMQKVQGFGRWMKNVVSEIAASSNEAWLSRVEQNNAAWDARVADTVARALVESQKITDEKIKTAIEESEKRQQKSLDELRSLIAGSAASAASVDGGASALRGSQSAPQSHIPRTIEVKGYIPDWERRRDTALTRDGLLDYTTRIKALLGTSPQTTALIVHIDWESIPNQLVYPYYTKITLPLAQGITREQWTRTHRAVLTCVREQTMKINGVNPRAVLEQSLEEQALSSEVARFYDTLRRANVDTKNIRSKWLRGVANTKVDIVEQCAGYDRLLGHFSTANATWALCGGNLSRLIPEFREEAFMMWLK